MMLSISSISKGRINKNFFLWTCVEKQAKFIHRFDFTFYAKLQAESYFSSFHIFDQAPNQQANGINSPTHIKIWVEYVFFACTFWFAHIK